MKQWLIVVCLLGVIGLVGSSQLSYQPVYALNGFIDPNGDGATGNWNTTGGTTFSTEIDDATRQPTAPGLTDTNTAAANNGGSINYRMNSISGVTTVSDVRVWIYHNDGSNGEITVQLFDDNETTTRSGTAVLTQSTANNWHSVLFSGLSLTQGQLDTLSIRLTAGKNGGGAPATITVHEVYADVTYTNVSTTYTQSAYRFFNSLNSTDVGTPLAAQDTTAVLNAGGDEFRLRLLIHVADADLASSGQNFKLQFAGRGTNACSNPNGTPSSYTDVTTGTIIAYNNLVAGVSDGDALTTNTNDPTHASDTIRAQTVEEGNNFTNSQAAIAVGEDGLWDFALVDNGAPAATVYCMRVVEADGTPLSTYDVYPQITTGNGVLAVDIVDATQTPVASPSYAMSPTSYLFTCDPTTTTVGTTAQRIEVSNFTATASWSVSIAATAGNTATWNDGGTNNYDFNDPAGTPAGCGDGGDTDSIAGQLTLDPSVGTSTPRAGCTNTGISLGSSAGFNEATVDAITLISASSSAQLSCSWELTDVDATQRIPSDQASGTYTINLTLTATAI
jgi:hypothetical protein